MKTFSLVRALILSLALAAIPAFAVNRTLAITAPESVKPGADIHVSIAVSTDAADAEQIGFLHAEYSSDNGKTWQTRYAEKVGRVSTMSLDFKAGADGSQSQVRVRIAFRGGKAGDVDFTGAPIKWGDSWGKWTTPPAKLAKIRVAH